MSQKYQRIKRNTCSKQFHAHVAIHESYCIFLPVRKFTMQLRSHIALHPWLLCDRSKCSALHTLAVQRGLRHHKPFQTDLVAVCFCAAFGKHLLFCNNSAKQFDGFCQEHGKSASNKPLHQNHMTVPWPYVTVSTCSCKGHHEWSLSHFNQHCSASNHIKIIKSQVSGPRSHFSRAEVFRRPPEVLVSNWLR